MQHSVDTGGNLTVSYATNILWKIQIEEYSPKIERFRCNSGYFIEIDVEHLFDLYLNFLETIKHYLIMDFKRRTAPNTSS